MEMFLYVIAMFGGSYQYEPLAFFSIVAFIVLAALSLTMLVISPKRLLVFCGLFLVGVVVVLALTGYFIATALSGLVEDAEVASA